MEPVGLRHPLDVVVRVLACDFACDVSCFTRNGVFIREAREISGRRRFPFRPRSLYLVTLGTGVVISCSADRLHWAQSTLAGLGRDDLFSAAGMWYLHEYVSLEGQYLCGPELKYVCARKDLKVARPPKGVKVELLARDEILKLYDTTEFYNALMYDADSPRPDVLAAVASVGEQIVGMAGASADSDELWQVGVDIDVAHRGRGLGRALVSRVTAAVLDHDKVPYYTTAIGNVPSSTLATRVGYRPAWTEIYAC